MAELEGRTFDIWENSVKLMCMFVCVGGGCVGVCALYVCEGGEGEGQRMNGKGGARDENSSHIYHTPSHKTFAHTMFRQFCPAQGVITIVCVLV